MSQQPEISGFRLAPLRSLLGSRDSAAAGAAAQDLDSLFLTDDPEVLEAAAETLHRAVEDGVPFPALDLEGEAHAVAAAALARHGQEHLGTGSRCWNQAAFMELHAAVGERLDPEAQRLLGIFLDGRPLFGRAIDSWGAFYGYLSFDEAAALKRALDGLAAGEKDPTGDGFLGELRGWLDAILAQGLDLWFVTA
jgi:hypothetical protein